MFNHKEQVYVYKLECSLRSALHQRYYYSSTALSRMSSVLAHLSDNTVEIQWNNGGQTLGTVLTLLVIGEEKQIMPDRVLEALEIFIFLNFFLISFSCLFTFSSLYYYICLYLLYSLNRLINCYFEFIVFMSSKQLSLTNITM